MTIDISVLQTEISNDPASLGYSAMLPASPGSVGAIAITAPVGSASTVVMPRIIIKVPARRHYYEEIN